MFGYRCSSLFASLFASSLIQSISTPRDGSSIMVGVTRAVVLDDTYSTDVAEIHHKVDNYHKATVDREHAMMATIKEQEMRIAFLLDDNKNISEQLGVQVNMTRTANTQSDSNFKALQSAEEQLIELQCLKGRANEEACSIELGLASRLEDAKKILSTTTEILRVEILSAIKSRATLFISALYPAIKRSSSQTGKRNRTGSRGSRRANSVLRSSVNSAVTAAVTALRPATATVVGNTERTGDCSTAITALFKIADALEVSTSMRFVEMREINLELEESESMAAEDSEGQQRRAFLIAERRARIQQLAEEAAARLATAAAALAVESAALAASAKTDRRYSSRQKNTSNESAVGLRGRIREGGSSGVQPSRDRKSSPSKPSPSKLPPSRASPSSMKKAPVTDKNILLATAASIHDNVNDGVSSRKEGRIRGVSAVPRGGAEMKSRGSASASPSRAQSARIKSSPTSASSASKSIRMPTPTPNQRSL